MDLTLLTFAAVAFLAIATPGPTVLLALNNGTRYGAGAALYGIGGAALSDLVLIGAVSLGLGAVLAASELLFAMLKWIGVAYLCYLGLGILRRKDGDEATSPASPIQPGVAPMRLVLRSFLVAVSNPKGYVFFTAFLPQFIDTSAALLPQYVLLTVIFVAIDVAVMAGYAALGAKAATRFCASGQRWIRRACGTAFLTLAAGLALYRRNAL